MIVLSLAWESPYLGKMAFIFLCIFSGTTACKEISSIILAYILLVLIRYIEAGKNFSVVAETNLKWFKGTYTSLGRWLAMTEPKYPVWYRNLELGNNMKDMLLDIAKAVDLKYSVWIIWYWVCVDVDLIAMVCLA